MAPAVTRAWIRGSFPGASLSPLTLLLPLLTIQPCAVGIYDFGTISRHFPRRRGQRGARGLVGGGSIERQAASEILGRNCS
eukprot:1061797-Amorphochlora_amoeboformis.AAC.3